MGTCHHLDKLVSRCDGYLKRTGNGGTGGAGVLAQFTMTVKVLKRKDIYAQIDEDLDGEEEEDE